jgi:hypothetical protein
MDLRGLMARDQVKIFGSVKDFGESIDYTDELGTTVKMWAFVEREKLDPTPPVGYGAQTGRQCLYIWIAQSLPEGRAKVTIGVDRILALWRRGDASKTTFRITAILPDSDGAWHLECTR